MNFPTRIANQIIQEQGYIIASFHAGPKPLPKIGEKIDYPMAWNRETVSGPFMVIGGSTREKYLAQTRKYFGVEAPEGWEPIGFIKLVAE